ncbi:MAG TPA: hypothetical protein VGM63_21715, partial [Mucilaginibacter sp.]
EGALRKWFLTGLSTPLLVIRDPIALWLIFTAYRRDVVSFPPMAIAVVLIGFFGIITALAFGHGNLFVALYGARILIVHFPLVFVIGEVFNRKDIIKLGKVMVWLALPMTVLITLQFYSPQSAWVNHAVGGGDGEGFRGALDFFRPPATFSFTNGTTLFYSFLAPFILYFWLDGNKINRLLLIAATGCLLASIPLSISRGLFFSVAVSLVFMLVAIFRKPQYAGKMFLAIIGAAIVFAVLSQTPFFQTATRAFTLRFTSANQTEGGVQGVFLDRFLGGMISALGNSSNVPLLGLGIGMGTNVGSMLLAGKEVFLISEGEWGRIIGELGPIFGLLIIAIRIYMAVTIAAKTYRKLVVGDLLSWMLLSFGFLVIAQGGWAQPTSLGFFVMAAGLLLASLKTSQKKSAKPVLISHEGFVYGRKIAG